MIRLEAEALRRLRAHAGESYPEECCGALLGGDDAEGVRRVARVAIMANARVDERERRYLIGPDAMLGIEAEARREGLEIVGFYHSHPDHPAVPSAFDREHAWPWYTYLIVPVARGEPGEARAWRLDDDRGRFDEEDLIVEERSS